MSDKNELKIVIVGGVAGGASAAARARRCNASAEITILEKGEVISYANCGLPYHLGGEIADRDRLIVAKPDLFWNRFRIQVRTQHEVERVDLGSKTVSGSTIDGERFQLPYDRLILATGSEPVRPGFMQEVACKNLFQFWTLDDMDRVLGYLKNHPCKRAIVVGAGLVGLEVVEQFVRLGIGIDLVELGPQVLGSIDGELARLVETELVEQGVVLHLASSVEELLVDGTQVTGVRLANGESLVADLVVVGAGTRPRIELARQAGLAIGGCGGVQVNEYCQTSEPSVYAVGDMMEYRHGVLGEPTLMPLAGPANRAGRVAGGHAAGGPVRPLGVVQGTRIVRVFGLAAGQTGLTARDCQRREIEYRTATVQAPHHAGYFPGARPLVLKIIYAPDGKLLGAEVVGAAGADKRLDVVASLLHLGGSVDDLAELDLAYAPPYGSAKDPLHLAAFAAQNDLDGHPALAEAGLQLDGKQVVDVRSAAELEKLPLPGAKHLPIDELAERYGELDPLQPTVTICHTGKRSHVAACWLQGRGFGSVTNLSGGMSIRRLLD